MPAPLAEADEFADADPASNACTTMVAVTEDNGAAAGKENKNQKKEETPEEKAEREAKEVKAQAYKDGLAAADLLDDGAFRAQLAVGSLCDLQDGANPDKWREAEVGGVSDDGKTLTVHWRGMSPAAAPVELPRESELIAKPYSQCRDWRNQMRVNTTIELHRPRHVLEDFTKRHPSYLNEAKTHFLFYDGKSGRWWITDVGKYRAYPTTDDIRGFLNIDCGTGVENPLDIAKSSKKWEYWGASKWLPDHAVTVTAAEGAGVVHGLEIPDKLVVAGHCGTEHTDLMGTYVFSTEGEYVPCTVKRISRQTGEVEVTVTVEKKTSYRYVVEEDVSILMELYGNEICELGTHTVKPETSRSAWGKSVAATGEAGRQGCAGLSNLGNTCFMNSMLQCLNAAPPLQEYFLSGRYKGEINTKNALGTGGILADAYGALWREIWDGKFSVVGPQDFKDKLSQFAPQFAGYAQQDSQELFQFLLDNIHEDCNRVITKPYTETVEDEGRPDPVVADESWDRHLLRNQSVVTDHMQGLFKSHLTCPSCGHEARKFDPYMSVALPVPGVAASAVSVVLRRKGPEGLGLAPGVRYSLSVPKSATWEDVAAVLAEKAGGGLHANSLGLYEMTASSGAYQRIYKTRWSPGLEPEKVNVYPKDEFLAFELFDPADAPAPTSEATKDKDGVDDKEGATVASTAGDNNNNNNNNNSSNENTTSTTTNSYNTRSSYSQYNKPNIHTHEDNALVAVQVRIGVHDNKRLPKEYWAPVDFEHRSSVITVPRTASCGEVKARVEEVIQSVIPTAAMLQEEELAAQALDLPEIEKLAVSDEPAAVVTDGAEAEAEAGPPALDAAVPAAPPAPIEFTMHPITERGVLDKIPGVISTTMPDPMVSYYLGIGSTEEELAQPWDFAKHAGGVSVVFSSASPIDFRVWDNVVDAVGDAAGDPDEISLGGQIKAFAERETLGEADSWYCPKCKDHVQAYKKMDLWSVPELLTFQLKRFLYEMTDMFGRRGAVRDKIDTLVHYPQTIDMAPYVIGPQAKAGEPLLYELYGVSNHMGGLNGGHYTAYGKHGSDWLQFDDSRVSPATAAEVCSPSGYVLFYKRVMPGAAAAASSAPGAAGGGDGGSDGAVAGASAAAAAGVSAAATAGTPV